MSRRDHGAPMAWALVQRYGRERHPHLVIEDVPAHQSAGTLGEVLEGWRHWAAYAPGVGAGSLVPFRRWSAELARECKTAPRVTWEELTAARRITVPLTPAQYSRVARAAAIANQPVIAWAAGVLEAAASAEVAR